jgi:protein SCO1/2
MTKGTGLVSKTLLLLTLLCGSIVAAASDERGTSVERFGGSFTLTASDGSTKTDESFRGRWMLVYFGYTHCPNICPMTLSAISRAIDTLGPLGANVQPIYITIDPERDTPEQMGEYTRAFDPRIVGLTGTPQAIALVAKEYRVFYQKVAGQNRDDYSMTHSSYIYVMDPNGRYVTLITQSEDPAAIAERMRQLLTTAGPRGLNN